MYILNNAILGKVLNKYALVLNKSGLHRRIRLDNRADYFIFLTDNIKKIAEIFALDFQTLSDKRDEEGCEFIKHLLILMQKSLLTQILIKLVIRLI